MTHTQHVALAAKEFERGNTIYRAKPDAGRSLKQLHKKMSILARQLHYEWSFKQFDGLVIVKRREPVQPFKLSQRGMRLNRI